MIRKRTNSDKRPDEYGFTLIELLAAMAVVVILGGAVMPRIYTVVEQNRQAAYQAEALQAYSAAELYIDEACSEGGMDTMTLYQKLIMTDLSDPENGLWEYTHGFCTEGARLNRVSMDRKNMELTAIGYVVDGYEIEVKKGKVVETEKKDMP